MSILIFFHILAAYPTSPSKTHIEMDVTAKSRDDSLTFDSRNMQGGTRGVDVRLVSYSHKYV